jgi:hypothetical protein
MKKLVSFLLNPAVRNGLQSSSEKKCDKSPVLDAVLTDSFFLAGESFEKNLQLLFTSCHPIEHSGHTHHKDDFITCTDGFISCFKAKYETANFFADHHHNPIGFAMKKPPGIMNWVPFPIFKSVAKWIWCGQGWYAAIVNDSNGYTSG